MYEITPVVVLVVAVWYKKGIVGVCHCNGFVGATQLGIWAPTQ